MSNPTTKEINGHLLIPERGIPLKKLRALRPASAVTLPNGVFWPLVDARACASHEGLTYTPATVPAGTVEVLRVVSKGTGSDGRHCPNPIIVRAERSNGDIVNVRVPHSRNFLPGEELRALKTADSSTWTRLDGGGKAHLK